MMFDPDTPISSPSEDRFGRAALATRLANMLAEPRGDDGLVVGIHGESGSGKTSLLRLVESSLHSRTDIAVVRFNPWMLETNPGPLILAFFATMRSAFRFEKRPELRRLDRLFRDYGVMCGMLAPPSMSSTWMEEGRQALGETLSARTVESLKEQIDEALQEAAVRIVVFIDDADRLGGVEMNAILRLVKLLANFRRTTFVLACDPARMAVTLEGSQHTGGRSSGADLLEKVVQVPIALGLPDSGSLRRLALAAVDKACLAAGTGLTADEVDRFVRRFDRALLRFVRTPRRARRYANALAFSLPLFNREEASLVDHLCLEGLRVLVPDVYRLVRDGGEDVLRSGLFGLQTFTSVREKFSGRLTELEPDAWSGVWWLLKEMFPRLDAVSNNAFPGNEGEHAWTRERRRAADGNRARQMLAGPAAVWVVPESSEYNGTRFDPQD
jgi:predicted KAP-like P-loop ATPase